jgi:cytochrome c oxidase subunit 2
MNLRTQAAGLAAMLAGAAFSAQAYAADLIGQPTPGGIDLQPANSALAHAAHGFHNAILLPIITVISLFVLALLIIVVVRFNAKANPVPAKFSHNTLLEIVWTLVPVGILLFIAIFSFKLLFAYHDMPKPDLTVKVNGYQWYWGYAYPDQKIDEITSVMLSEDDAKKQNVPFRLAADTSMVVPVGKTVRVLVTGQDVIHAFFVPAFGVMTSAIPGRVNEIWFKAEKTGIFYGQCTQLCGSDHAFMPIQVEVVTQAEFDAWVASKAPKPAPVAAAAAAAPAPADAAVPAAATAPAPQKIAQLDTASKPVAMN